jgi:phage baseplate assembly protein W
MAIFQKNIQIQPKWPLQIDESSGPFVSVGSAAESLKQDFVFLLRTIPGEWPMNPDLGVGLATYLFESLESLETSGIKSHIENQLGKYLSNIKLVDVKFISTPENVDNYVSTLKITYAITDFGIQGEINFGLNEVEKSMVDIGELNSHMA